MTKESLSLPPFNKTVEVSLGWSQPKAKIEKNSSWSHDSITKKRRRKMKSAMSFLAPLPTQKSGMMETQMMQLKIKRHQARGMPINLKMTWAFRESRCTTKKSVQVRLLQQTKRSCAKAKFPARKRSARSL